MKRTMLKGCNLLDILWKEAIYIAVHILNRVLFRTNSDKTPYDLWRGMPTSVKHFRIFGSKCYIKRNEDNFQKIDPRADEGIFLGYSPDNKAYKCFNLILSKIVTSVDVILNDEKMAQISTNSKIKEEEDDSKTEQHQDTKNKEKTRES